MEPIETAVKTAVTSALTGASAQPTKAAPAATKVWAEWFKLSLHSDPELERLVRKCADFATAYQRSLPPRWITILGESGIGKTHCARRLWDYSSRRANWMTATYAKQPVYWPKFVSELRDGTAYGRLRDMMSWPILFIDDIGAERDPSGFAAEQLGMLLGCRENKWTILTSNLLLDQLGAIDPRISDRIIRAPNLFIEVKTESHALRTLKS